MEKEKDNNKPTTPPQSCNHGQLPQELIQFNEPAPWARVKIPCSVINCRKSAKYSARWYVNLGFRKLSEKPAEYTVTPKCWDVSNHKELVCSWSCLGSALEYSIKRSEDVFIQNGNRTKKMVSAQVCHLEAKSIF